MKVIEFISQPWPWYVAGPLIGLMVPVLLLVGNKNLGISSSLRHVCAMCVPAKVPFFTYDWKRESWNLFFVGGVLLGGLVAASFFMNTADIALNPKTVADLQAEGLTTFSGYMPATLFSWQAITTAPGLISIALGGFLVGFGTRYGGGCTSGHAIMGLSSLQWPSLVATASFFIGGILVTWFITPLILAL